MTTTLTTHHRIPGLSRPLRATLQAIAPFVPLVALPALFVCVRPWMPAWAFMWTLAMAIFFGCKVMTWAREAPAAIRRNPSVAFAYFFTWAGMNPAAFLHRGEAKPIHAIGWIAPAARILIGAALLWLVLPRIPMHPMAAGWVGMTGLVLLLHFGLFDLLALAWEKRGAAQARVMNAPTHATSLADFWGRRWNTAFHHLAHRYLFAPLRRPLGGVGAMMATFVASGIVHDIVISVPAAGGYGLPTAYFLVQGAGVLFERSTLARRAGLGRGLRGRLFTMAVVVAPLPWLFHEPFITQVILPFLRVIGAL